MDKIVLFLLPLLFFSPLKAQVNYTANEQVLPYTGSFRPGLNSGVYPGFTDEHLANLAAGNPEVGNKGVGTKALRPGLFESFTSEFGTDSRVSTFQHYYDLDIRDNTVIVGFPGEVHQDPEFYCTEVQSQLFANLYEPIWDDGSDGTPYNEDNYYAAYLWEVVNTYQDYVKFWEIWNEPGFDYTSNTGYLNPGQEGNWWDNNPDPCDYKLRAPIFHYIRLLRISWEIIKSVDESAYVVVSGTGYPSFLDAILRNTDNPADGSVSGDYPLGGGAYFDVFGFHSYPHFDGSLREYSNELQDFINFRHSDAAAEGFAFIRDQYQEVFYSYGYDGTNFPEKLWTITECNLPRVPFDDYIGSTEAQRNFMIKAYVAAVELDFVQLDIYKIAEDETDETAYNEFDLLGLYYKLDAKDMYFNEPNEAGIAMRTATDLLYGKSYDAARTSALNLPDFVKGAAFVDDYGNYTYVLWARTQTDQSESASAVYSFPSDWSMHHLLKREWDYGASNQIEVIEGQNIALTGEPIFLSEQAFSADNLNGCAPLQIQFTDLSSDAVEWQWTFAGDGTPTFSSLQNPQLTLFQPGIYTATLQAFDNTGEIVAHQTQNIEVFAPAEPQFSTEVSGPIVNFLNESDISSENFFWNFGDGNTSSEPNPSHVYLESGSYTVELSAENGCGPVTYSIELDINVPSIYYVEETANDLVPGFDGDFRVGYNFGYYPNFTDQDVADIAAGNPSLNIKGAGARSVRTFIGEFFVNFWDYDIRLDAFEHYANLGMTNNTMTLDFPDVNSIDSTEYCPGHPSRLFKDLYTEIWDEGANGTPINENNPYAVYVYNMVQTYGDYVKYWEIVTSPDFDRTGESAYLPPGEPGNWWDNNPDPCDYELRAPIFHYIRTLRISYEIIKFLQPDDYVAISGIGFPAFLDVVLRNTDNPIDGTPTTGYERTGGAYFDVLGFKSFPHFDGSTSFYDTDIGGFVYERHSDAAAEGIAFAKSRFEEVLESYGYGTTLPAKEWIIAEANVPRFAFDEFLGGADVQRNWIGKAYVQAAKSGIQQMNIFNLTERTYGGNATRPFDAMGLYQRMDETGPGGEIINEEGIALRTVSTLLFGREYDSAQTITMNLPEEVGGAAFKDLSGEFTYVLWAKTDTDKSEANTAVYDFPAALGLSDLYKREWDWGETELTQEINATGIALSASPIFLTENQEISEVPLAVFSSDMQSGCPGLSVQFNNQSTGDGMSWFWEFPGGIPATSTEENPSVVYPESGVFSVSLTVSNAAGEHTMSTQNYIDITAVPTPGFSFTADGPWVSFENTSEGSYYHTWDFGDDSNSTANNPEHFYFENGIYEVVMTAFNDCFSAELTQEIVVAAAPNARFSADFMGNCNVPVLDLNDESYSSPTEWLWEFPEGSPAVSDQQFPQVTYAQGGLYEVSLTVSNDFGSSTETKHIYVPGNTFELIERDLCDNYNEEIGGILFDADNPTGTVELETAAGCDSTLQVNFTIAPTYEIDLDATITNGESYQVGTFNFTEPGAYEVQLYTQFTNCDSIVNLNLTVLSSADNPLAEKFKVSLAPNPFEEDFSLQFDLPAAANLSLDILDVYGRRVRSVFAHKSFSAGINTIPVERNDLTAGLYFCKLQIEEEVVVLRVVCE